jgi:hypothetical protein
MSQTRSAVTSVTAGIGHHHHPHRRLHRGDESLISTHTTSDPTFSDLTQNFVTPWLGETRDETHTDDSRLYLLQPLNQTAHYAHLHQLPV